MILVLVGLVQFILKAIFFLIFIRIILSFVSPDPYNPVVQWVYRLTEPLLSPFRKLPLTIGMIDFSPMVAILVIHFVGEIVMRLLLSLRSF